MAKSYKKVSHNISKNKQEWDIVFLLKIVLFLVISSQWVYVIDSSSDRQLSIPYGALIGIIFALQDHFQIDRKIEYAVIVIAMFIGYGLPMGITILR